MNKYKSILILVFCSLVPLLFTSIIPFALPKRLNLNSIAGNEHAWTGELKLYAITLEAGNDYTITVNSGPWSMDASLRIGDTPYIIDDNRSDNYPLMSPIAIADFSDPSYPTPSTPAPLIEPITPVIAIVIVVAIVFGIFAYFNKHRK